MIKKAATKIIPKLLKEDPQAFGYLKGRVTVAFQDETWTELYPRVEARWMKRGHQDKIDTPGFNKRRNVFVTLFWPDRKIVYNTFAKRRSAEFKRHLGNVISYSKRHRIKKVILFVDHARSHKTNNVKRFIRNHPILKVKRLPKKAPHLNPVEKLVNASMKSVVGSNRSYQDIEQVVENTQQFLRWHKCILCT